MENNSKTSMSQSRRIAVNRVVLPDSSVLNLAILELDDGVVTNIRPLTKELPFTEWVGGCAELHAETDGRLRAYKEGKIIK